VSRAAASGNGVVFSSKAAFAGSKSGTPYPQYLARRGLAGWTTEGISPPMESVVNTLASEFFQYVSPDLDFGAVATTGILAQGAPADAFSLYLQRLTSPLVYDLVSKPSLPLVPSDPASTAPANVFAAASADARHVAFESTRRLTAGAPPEDLFVQQPFVYEAFDGSVRLVSVVPGPGNPPALGEMGVGASGVYTGASHPGDHPMSRDGSRIFFTVTDRAALGPDHRDLDRALYVREGGTSTLSVSASEGVAPSAEGGATFLGARDADGGIAFFTSDKRLTPAATAQVTLPDLYRWDRGAVPGSRLTDLTPGDPDGAGVLGSLGMADDASRLYFAATGNLAAGPASDEPKLYLWQAGEGTRYVATLDAEDKAGWSATRSTAGEFFRDARVTPDGRYLVFASRAGLDPGAPAGVRQIYRYDAVTGDLRCVSCTASADPAGVDAALISYTPSTPGLAPVATPFLARNLSRDGRRVLFDTAAALVPGDANQRIDVYEWEDGNVGLISSGVSSDDSRFVDAGDDGNDVFFTTRQRLVGADRDDLMDLYDARVGGGFPEPVSPLSCEGDACQSPPDPPPAFPGLGSSTFRGPGNPPAVKRKAKHAPKHCRKAQVRKRVRGKVRCVKKPRAVERRVRRRR
jgi:hypothetical protein